MIVGAEPLLFAVLDDAKYPLRPLGVDTFQNAGGDTIPFRRSADGAVSGFVERGVFFARLSPVVDPEIAAAVRARPRPVGPDGGAVPYEYRMPADLGDGLAVGEVSQAGLDRAVATRLVDRVVDGTYRMFTASWSTGLAGSSSKSISTSTTVTASIKCGRRRRASCPRSSA